MLVTQNILMDRTTRKLFELASPKDGDLITLDSSSHHVRAG